MTFLPIVGRELRVVARQRLTYWGRFSAAAFALLIFGGFQTIYFVSRGGFNPGYYQFEFMKWLCFAIACSAGLFLTADTLSEEKREGTLGLLFLTDLRGYDVVFGKLFAQSARAFYGLLAAFPIMGLSLLTGGVSGAEFGRASLVICNTLFLSLAIGLLVSSVSRHGMKALNGTLLLLLTLIGLTFIGDFALAHWNPARFKPFLCLASPAYLLYLTSSYLVKNWWVCLGLQHLLAWVSLALSSVCVPRAWQDRAIKTNAAGNTFGYRWRFGGPRGRLRRRRKLLERNPLLWLAARDRWLGFFAWIVALLSLGVFLWRVIYHAHNRMAYWAVGVDNLAQFLVRWIFFLWVASQASRFFVDAIRNGAMELILVTPATPAQVVKGQWRALCRIFLLPSLLLLSVMVGSRLLQIWETGFISKGNPGSGVVSGLRGGYQFNFVLNEMINIVSTGVLFVTGLPAVAWFGMWMGMTTRKNSMAVLKTLAFVIVLPWLAAIFVEQMVRAWIMLPTWRGVFPFWTAAIVFSALMLAKNLFFIFWSRNRLACRFLAKASGDYQFRYRRPVLPLPPSIPPSIRSTTGAPPVQPPAPPPVIHA